MADERFDYSLSLEEQTALLRVARKAIEYSVRGGEVPRLDFDYPVFHENRGAFVTILKKDQLRGCIGFVLAAKPLAETISEMAVAAAQRDPRFSSITADELDDLSIEISVLSPLHKISDVSIIKTGVHGIFIKKGFQSGLLLPQVAEKYNWNRDEFLEQTCFKAGLPGDAWKDDETIIEIFSAHVFSEDPRG